MEDWSRWLLNSLVERVSDAPTCTAGELAIVMQDRLKAPAWWAAQLDSSPDTARYLIRMANSAAHGHGSHASNVLEAVEILSHTTARHLIFTRILEGMFPMHGRQWLRWSSRWRHVLAVASIGAELARVCGMKPGEVFVAGLFHELGKIVLLQHGGEPYARLEATFQGDPDPLAMKREEQAYLGFDNGYLGAILAVRWGLPPTTISLIRDHGRLESLQSKIAHGKHLKRVALLALAEELASALGYGHAGEAATSWWQVSRALSGSAANQILGLSSLRLFLLRRPLEAQIKAVMGVARGSAGQLWTPLSALAELRQRGHDFGAKLWLDLPRWTRREPRKLAVPLKPAEAPAQVAS